MLGSLHPPSLQLLHPCPCTDTPKVQTSVSVGRLRLKCHHVCLRLHPMIPAHAARLLALVEPVTAWTTLFSLGGLLPSGHIVFAAKARFLRKGLSSQGCYSQAGFDRFFLSPPSSSRLRGKRSPSESDLEASPWSKREGVSKEGEGPWCTDTPLKKTDSRLQHHTYRSTEFCTTMQHHLSQNDACTYLYHRLINLLPGRQTASGSKHGPRKGSEKNPYCLIFAAGIAHWANEGRTDF